MCKGIRENWLIWWCKWSLELLNLFFVESIDFCCVGNCVLLMGIVLRMSKTGLCTPFSKLSIVVPIVSTKGLWFPMKFQSILLSMPQFLAIITPKVVLIARWPWLITPSTFSFGSTSWTRTWFCNGKSWVLHAWGIKHHNSLPSSAFMI